MKQLILLTTLIVVCSACSVQSKEKTHHTKKTVHTVKHTSKKQTRTSSGGNKVLKTGYYMAITSREVIRGSCWDYINAVYNRAGYPQAKRKRIFKGKKNGGPYARANLIQPGDWLYFINHSYHNSEHSGVFVKWVNKKKRIAKVLSYGGQSRKKPGRYRNYDLSHVYNIIRPKD